MRFPSRVRPAPTAPDRPAPWRAGARVAALLVVAAAARAAAVPVRSVHATAIATAACGDADGSGSVTVTDGVRVLRTAAALPGDCQQCDTDGSGAVTVTDGVNVLRAAAALPATLTCDGLPPPGDPRSGGEAATVFDATAVAFAQPVPVLSNDERRAFFTGNALFNRNWVTAPSSTEGSDGLGPLFNALSCSACHFKDGRGRPPLEPDERLLSMLVRASVPGGDPVEGVVPEPVYGTQIAERSILGVPTEARTRITWTELPGTYGDGTPYTLRAPTIALDELGYGPPDPDLLLSARVAPPVHGMGLLAAVTDAAILALADPDDADGDGVSGRANRVWDVRRGDEALGRFGWKAGVPTVEQQSAAAFLGDIGITSELFPDEACTPAETACAAAPTGGTPEVDALKLDLVTFYIHALAVPARRDVDDPEVRRGEALFDAAGCERCHVRTLVTGDAPFLPALAGQTIHPWTDLLLHDLGDGLADGRPEFAASGREWRTPPLWGIGLVPVVNDHALYLHDGRARGLAEAVLWHGGEAEAAREAFRALSAADRAALVRFLASL